MQPSFTVMVAAIVAVVAAAGWMLLGSHSRHRRLERLRDARDAADAEARCVAAFPSVDPPSAHAAYRWVQALVEVEDMPLHPDDELEALLGIDPGEIDDKFGACREFAGAARPGLEVPGPRRTVCALMAAVLAAGCELDPADAA
jgi:hypothetical protein